MKRRDFDSPNFRRLQNKQFLDKVFEIQRRKDLELEEEEKEKSRLEKKARKEEKKKSSGIIKAKNVVLGMVFGLSVLCCILAPVSIIKSEKSLKKFKDTKEYKSEIKSEINLLIEKYERKEIDETGFVEETKKLETNSTKKLLDGENETLKKEYNKAKKQKTASEIVLVSAFLTSVSLGGYEIAKTKLVESKEKDIFTDKTNSDEKNGDEKEF